MMQAMGRTYVQRLNARYRRTGTLWEGRYKASLVQTEVYLLACQRYIELNPVRSGMVAAPGEYPYSSYAYNALGENDPLLTPHPTYLALHADPATRLQVYRAFFENALSEELLTRLRENTNACTVIGNKRFKEQLATMIGRAVPSGKRGRPRKTLA
jgi:putative transposase